MTDLELQFIRSADMCYSGQAYHLNILIPEGVLDHDRLETVNAQFHDMHKKLYGYARLKHPTEMIHLRLSAVAVMSKPTIPQLPRSAEGVTDALRGRRRIFLNGRYVDAPVYARERLRPADYEEGPAVIGQFDTTILVAHHQKWRLDESQNIRIKLDKAELPS